MIIWLNGAFGCGKTSPASELGWVIPGSRLFDPETVGYLLRPNLADHAVTDFQRWPPWRPLDDQFQGVLPADENLPCAAGG